MEHIGQRIKDLRKKADLTQDRLADYLGVTSQAVSKWEVGSASPDLALIAPLCRVLGCSADELLGIGREEDRGREAGLLEELRGILSARPGTRIDTERFRALSERAAAEFPRNLWFRYYAALGMSFDGKGASGSRADRKRAEEIYREILGETRDEELRQTVLSNLSLLLATSGRKEEAAEFAAKCRNDDLHLLMCFDGEERIVRFQTALRKKLWELSNLFGVGEAQIGDEVLKTGILDAWEGMLRAAVPDGGLHDFRYTLTHIRHRRAVTLTKTGRYAEAVRELGRMMENAEAEDREERAPEEERRYACPLFNRLSAFVPAAKEGDVSHSELAAEDLEDPSFGPLWGRPDYIALLERYCPGYAQPAACGPVDPEGARTAGSSL